MQEFHPYAIAIAWKKPFRNSLKIPNTTKKTEYKGFRIPRFFMKYSAIV
jgi:hypothetical protein